MLNLVNVLIVEDELFLRETIGEMFVNAGAIVDFAADGDSAFVKVSQNNYDVVLSDIKMPGLGGVELMKKINCLPEKKPLCFFLTGSIGCLGEELEKLGVAKLFLKPFSTAALIEEIALALQRRSEGFVGYES